MPSSLCPIVSFYPKCASHSFLRTLLRIVELISEKACDKMSPSNTEQKASFNRMIGKRNKRNQIQDDMKIMRRKILRKEIWRHRELYIFLLPALVALIIFSYIPMYGIVIAFQDVKFGR